MGAVLATVADVLLILAAAWAMLLAVRRRWPAGWLSYPLAHPGSLAPDEPEDMGGFDDEDDAGAGVREPRRPLPSSGGAAANAEPDERAA